MDKERAIRVEKGSDTEQENQRNLAGARGKRNTLQGAKVRARRGERGWLGVKARDGCASEIYFPAGHELPGKREK